jgi:DNA polymerase I-like protein with 3'-5' exonuclease and polymerase domains
MHINYITTPDTYTEAIGILTQHKKICLDFETTGLQARLAKPRLLQLCDSNPTDEDRTVYVFDLFKVQADSALKELVESREMIIGQNLNFDLQFLYELGIDFKNKIYDTYIAERVLRSGFKEKKISPQAQKPYFADLSCSLKAIALRRLNIELDKEQRRTDWSQPELTLEQIEYAAKDVDVLPRIAADQLEELREENLTPIYSVESQCVRPVALMCYTGFGVDITKLMVLRKRIEDELVAKTEQFINELDFRLPEDCKLPRSSDGSIAVGKKPKKEFNPGSTAQIVNVFSSCNIELPKDATTGKTTLNQIALSEFDSEDSTLILYRERTKIETRLEHVNKLISNINPVTHRIHSGYNQVGANSGRFTSNGSPKTTKTQGKTVYAVNIQQVPRSKDFRECFIAAPGYKLVICDWAQIELRLGAELINIAQMKEAFVKNIDLHTLTASLIYKIDISLVTKEQRQEGKTLNFALLYGMGYRKYKTYAAQSGKMISLSEAKIAHAAFHLAYPRLRAWHQERASLVQEGWAYIRTACGRRRLLSYDDATMMCSANTLIQGSGADILKLAIADLNKHLNEDVRLVAAVHDELVLEVKEELAETYKEILETTMIKSAETVLKSVPSSADASVGSSWAAK